MVPTKVVSGEGRKDDQDKIRTDLFSVVAFNGTSTVLTFGAKKYAPWNWAKGINYMRVYGALLRHLFAWVRGQQFDEETGLPHLDHAACCIMFLQHYDRDGERYKTFDDRPYGKIA